MQIAPAILFDFVGVWYTVVFSVDDDVNVRVVMSSLFSSLSSDLVVDFNDVLVYITVEVAKYTILRSYICTVKYSFCKLGYIERSDIVKQKSYSLIRRRCNEFKCNVLSELLIF